MRASRLPALASMLWVGATLLWWGFAFLPVPSAPPEWLSAARAACFGSAESGLPAPYGWALLVLAPASFLAGILLLWGRELGGSLGGLARSRVGAVALGVLGAVTIVEAGWVSAKLRAGGAAAAWDAGEPGPGALPASYPRQAATAPDFALVDQHGDRVSLGRFRGKPVALAFVFAHCETMCPLLVQHLKRAAPGAPPSEVLLVTLDPWRDTPSGLGGIARRWEMPPNFHVLSSASVDEVLRVIQAYRVPFERNEKTGDITHPGLVFLVDAQGRLAYTFNNPPPAWIREGLARLAAGDLRAG